VDLSPPPTALIRGIHVGIPKKRKEKKRILALYICVLQEMADFKYRILMRETSINITDRG
jgi:hypothetical protein